MLMEKNEKREELHVKLHAPSTKEVPERKSHWSDNLFYLYFSIFFQGYQDQGACRTAQGSRWSAHHPIKMESQQSLRHHSSCAFQSKRTSLKKC